MLNVIASLSRRKAGLEDELVTAGKIGRPDAVTSGPKSRLQ